MNSKIGGIAAAFGFVLSLIIGLAFRNGAFAFVRALVFAAFFFVLVNILRIVIQRFLPELLDFGPELGADPRPGSRVNITEGDGAAGMLGDEAGLESLDSRQGRGDGAAAAQPDLSSERFSENGVYGGGLGGAPPPGPGGGLDGLGGLSGLGGAPPSGPGLEGNFPAGRPSVPALDQSGEAGYNEKGAVSDFEAEPRAGGGGIPPRPAPRGDAALPDGGSSVDVLPDFEAMSQAFLASTREPEPASAEEETAGRTEDLFQLSVTGQAPDPSSQYYTGNKPVEMEGDFPPKHIAQAIQTVLKRDEQ
jgi:hypothetical protein